MPTIELKPCPFCGKMPFINPTARGPQKYYVACGGCHAMVGTHETAEEAAVAWNRRDGDQPQPKKRRNKHRCKHFRFPTAEAEDEWCAKYGPYYSCLGAHGCGSYEE